MYIIHSTCDMRRVWTLYICTLSISYICTLCYIHAANMYSVHIYPSFTVHCLCTLYIHCVWGGVCELHVHCVYTCICNPPSIKWSCPTTSDRYTLRLLLNGSLVILVPHTCINLGPKRQDNGVPKSNSFGPC